MFLLDIRAHIFRTLHINNKSPLRTDPLLRKYPVHPCLGKTAYFSTGCRYTPFAHYTVRVQRACLVYIRPDITMPFKSEKQRRFLWAEHPEIAKRWAHEYPNQKKLPMYADNSDTSESQEKEPESKEKTTKVSYRTLAHTAPDDISISDMLRLCVNNRVNNMLNISGTDTRGTSKTADSKQEIVDIPHSSKPVYAGEERNNGTITGDIPDGKNISGTNSEGAERGEQGSNNAINELLTKLSVVLSPHIEQTIENMRAEREGRVARRIPRNRGVKQYPVATPTIPLPMGMQQPQPQQAQNQQPLRPVGGGSHPQFNPINAFGAISMSGEINGNAAFGAKNSPDSSKIAEVIKHATRSEALVKLMDLNLTDPADVDYYNEEFEEEIAGRKAAHDIGAPVNNIFISIEKWANKETPCSCGCGDTVSTCKCGPDCKCRKVGGSCYKGAEEKSAGKQLGLWDRIRMKKERGEKPAQPGDKDYPDSKNWKKVTNISEKEAGTPAWQRSEGKNEAGGLNEKGRKSYEREHGGNLKAPVTQKNPKGEAKKRQNSFCSRMCGMKRVNTGSKTKSDPDSRINKSLRKWNCKCSSALEFGMKLAAAPFALPPTNNPQDPRVQLQNLVGPQQTQAYQQRVQRGTTAMNQLMGRGQTGAPTVRSALLGGSRGAVGQSLFPGPK